MEDKEAQLKYIGEQINTQKQLEKNIYEYCNLIMNSIIIANSLAINWDNTLVQMKKATENIKENIEKLEMLKEKVEKEEIEGENLQREYLEISKNINEVQVFEHTVLSKIKEILIESSKREERPVVSVEKPKVQESIEITEQTGDNRVLLISEIKQKVYLPYRIKDIEKILEKDDRYQTIEEVIQSKYILDLSGFKNSITSRFKESYNLIKNKEHKSVLKAIRLGLELMQNYKLHPAVIAACRNEDELDIYLDYLEDNEIELFDIFDIQYEVAPVIVKRKKDII